MQISRHSRTLRFAAITVAAGSIALAQGNPAPAAGDTTVLLEKFLVQSVNAPTANAVAGAPQLKFESPNSSVLNVISQLPGVNVSQGDPFGGDDWSTRIIIRGFDTDQLGYTVDGLPVGQTGYGGGTKPNRLIDPETLSSVVVSQGASDVGSPGLQALGGTLAYSTLDPLATAGGSVRYTTGSFNLNRAYLRGDSGTFAGGQTAYLSFSRATYNRWIGSGSNGQTERLHLDGKWKLPLATGSLTTSVHFDQISPEINYQGISKSDFAANPRWDRLTWNWTGNPQVDQNFAETWTTERDNLAADSRLDMKVSDAIAVTVHPYFHHQQGRGGWLPPYQIRRYDLNGNPSGLTNYVAPGRVGTVYFQDASGADLLPKDPATGAKAGDPSDIGTYTWLTSAQQGAAKALSSRRYSRYLMNRYGAVSDANWSTGANSLTVGMWNEVQERDRARTWHAVLDPKTSWAYNDVAYAKTFDWSYTTTANQFYAKDEYRIDGLTLSGGLKYYLVHLKARQSLLNSGGHFSPGASMNSNSQVLPSIGAQYQLTPESQLFASYTRNFKAVPDNVLEIIDTGRDPSTAKPEKSGNIDFGYRYLGHRNVGLSATAFFAKYTDKLLYLTNVPSKVYDAVGTGAYVNIGGIKTYGAELATTYRLGGGFTLSGAYSYTHATYTDTVDVITAGKRVVDTPEQLLTASLAYAHRGFEAGVSGKYTSKRYGTFDNDEYASAYTTTDGYVGYTRQFSGDAFIKSLGLAFNVTNVFDRNYLANTSINDLGSPPKHGPSLYLIGPPRAFSFTVTLGF